MLIDIGIPANKNQSSAWWPHIMNQLLECERLPDITIGNVIAVGSAMPSMSKNQTAAFGLKRANLTDMNRNQVTFMSGPPTDAIFWIDDDTVPPVDALPWLIALDADVAAGVYVFRNEPFLPIMYLRTVKGKYWSISEYQRGQIIHADSVGMGCTLVKTYVYDEIRRQYVLFRREETNSLIAVHRDDVILVDEFNEQAKKFAGKTLVGQEGVIRLEKLIGPIEDNAVECWPYYMMEYGRTEDHYFCEMVKRCGFDIVVDTSVECEHWGAVAATTEDMRALRSATLAKMREDRKYAENP